MKIGNWKIELKMSFETGQRENVNDKERRVHTCQCRKVKGRSCLKQKCANGKYSNAICTYCHDNDNIVRLAKYKDSYGIKCLCAGHAHDNGTHSVQKACVVCGLDSKCRDESGYYCATHARHRGIYTPQVTRRRKCVNDEKIGCVRDPASGDALCCACATQRGIKYNSCVMCPAETAYVGHWRHPVTRKLLCAAHAREMNVYTPLHKSRDVFQDMLMIFEDESVLDLI